MTNSTKLAARLSTSIARLGTTLVAGMLAVAVMLAPGVSPVAADPTTADPTTQDHSQPGPIDRAAIRKAVAGLPDARVTAAQVRVSGLDGHAEARGGVRELGSASPVPDRARYRIASGTKMFTATLLLQLASEGEVELSAPVQRYLPGVLPPSYPPIPVESLLDHTSGLPTSDEDAGHEDPAYFVAHRFDSFTPHQVIATATDDSMSFPPGTAQQYNGVNYFLAGLVIEAATGHSYARELKQRILRPLRLGDTLLPDAEDPTIPGAHAHSYLRVQDAPVDITLQSPYGWAESGIISTTADQQRFLRALLEGRILKRAEQRHLFGVPDLPYAGDDCGPSARACYSSGLTRTVLPGGVVVWGKSGSLPGTSSGAFGTRDGSRLLTYALHPLGNRDGSEGPVLQGIVTAAFGLR